MDKPKPKILLIYWQLLKKSGAPIYLGVMACILIAAASIFQLLGLGLIVPVLNGLVDETSFVGIRTAPVLGKLINILPISQTNTNIFICMILLIFSAVVLENTSLYYGRAYICRITEILITNIRSLIFSKFVNLGRDFFDRKNLPEINTLIVYYVNISLAAFTNYLSMFIIFSFFSLVYLIMMFTISWQLSLCAIVLLPITHIFARMISKIIQNSADKEMSETINISTKVDEIFSNISLVQLRNQQPEEVNSFKMNVIAAGRHGTKVRLRSYLVPCVLDVINASGALLIVAVSVLLFFTFKSYSLGRLLVFFVSLRRFTSSVQQLSSTLVCSTAEEPALLAISEALFSDYPEISSGNLDCPKLLKSIQFENVSFSYKVETPILKDISFVMPANTITALVGPTGGGKSTIAHLIPRFYELKSGRILFDGQDSKSFKLEALRSKIALVSQREMLFNTTIRENICYGISSVDEERYQKALEQAQLVETIKRFPEGDLTIIGSHGVRLSGGEKQRIQIARAILQDPEILILDEATSSLDAETESEFDMALNVIVPDRTVLVIAHRLQTVKKANQIFFIEAGQILESGSFNELYSKNGKFAEYCRLQHLL